MCNRTFAAVVAAGTLSLLVHGGAEAQPTTARWLEPAGGQWTEAARWSTDPLFPNNGSPSGATYHAVIDAAGGAYTVTLPDSSSVAVDALLLDAPGATLAQLPFATLSAGTLSINAGTYLLGGGTLLNTTIAHVGPVGTLAMGNNSALSNVTVAAPLTIGGPHGIWLYNGLTLRDGATLTLSGTPQWHSRQIEARGFTAQSIAGQGEVVLTNQASIGVDPLATLVIEPGVTVRASGAASVTRVAGWNNTVPNLVNRGVIATGGWATLVVDTVRNENVIRSDGGRLVVDDVTNAGTITATGGTIDVHGQFPGGTIELVNTSARIDLATAAQLTGVRRTGGTLTVMSVNSTGDTLDLDRTGTIFVREVRGGTLRGANDPTALRALYEDRATLYGVTVAAPLTLLDEFHFDDVSLDNVTLGVRDRVTLSGTLGGTGTVAMNAATASIGNDAIGVTATIGPGITITTGTADGEVRGTSLTNRGRIHVTPGRSLDLGAIEWVNEGSLSLDNGTLILDGGVRPDNLGALHRVGGTVVLASLIENAGRTLDLDDTPAGSVNLGGAGIIGGTVTAASGREVPLHGGSSGACSLTGVTLDADLRFDHGAEMYAFDGLTLADRTLRFTSAFNTLYTRRPWTGGGTHALLGAGTLLFDTGVASPNRTMLVPQAGDTLVVGPDVVIATETGGGVLGGRIDNRGLISARTPGNVIRVDGELYNAGTLEAINGGALWLNAPVTGPGALRVVDATLVLGGSVSAASFSGASMSGAQVIVAGVWQNAGNTIVVRDAGRSIGLGSGGTINGGTIASTDGGALKVFNTLPAGSSSGSATATLSGVRLRAPVELQPGARLLGRSLVNEGTIDMAAGDAVTLTDAWSNLGRITADRGTLTLSGTWTSGGRIDVNGPATLALAGAWSNAGSIAVAGGGTLVLGGTPAALGDVAVTDATLAVAGTYTTASLRGVARTNAPVRVVGGGTLENAGDVVDVHDPRGAWLLAGGRVRGGTIASSTGAPFAFDSGVLDGVRLTANAVVRGASASIYGGLHLDDVTVTVDAQTSVPPSGRLGTGPFAQTITGTGTIVLEGVPGTTPSLRPAGALTLGPGVTLRAASGNAEVARGSSAHVPLTNHGTIVADGTTLTALLDVVSGGLVEARNGGVYRQHRPGAAPSSLTNTGTVRAADMDSLLQFDAPLVNNGTVDMNGRAVFYSPVGQPGLAPQVRAQIVTGYNDGAWDGPGINSSFAATNDGYAVGYAEATDVFETFPATWGAWQVYANGVLVSRARYGDANLDGLVSLSDFNRLAADFGATAGAAWSDGDFNYDGRVNLQDFNLLAANFGLSAAGPGVMPRDWAALAATVPEPSASLSALLLIPLLRRRSPRSCQSACRLNQNVIV